jgi:hypothetical protein
MKRYLHHLSLGKCKWKPQGDTLHAHEDGNYSKRKGK